MDLDPRLPVLVLSVTVVIAGTTMIVTWRSVERMAQYILPALGVTFVVPLILMMVFYKAISPDAAAAIGGAMVAYFFGGRLPPTGGRRGAEPSTHPPDAN